MKKINLKLALTILASLLMLLTFGCNKKDGNNPVGGGDSELVGSWTLTGATINPGTDSAQVFDQTLLQFAGVSIVLAINSDGSYSMTTTDPDGTSVENGNWSVTNGNITITAQGEQAFTTTYSITGNQLTLNVNEIEFGGDVFPAILIFTKQ
jgi:hypothetical protein